MAICYGIPTQIIDRQQYAKIHAPAMGILLHLQPRYEYDITLSRNIKKLKFFRFLCINTTDQSIIQVPKDTYIPRYILSGLPIHTQQPFITMAKICISPMKVSLKSYKDMEKYVQNGYLGG